MRKILFFLSLWSASVIAADFPMIVDPVVNETPPGATVTAGYMTLINKTENAITITDAYSPSISQVEIHLSNVKNDVATMEKQDEVTIDAGGTLAFTHGSYHLMLMNLTAPLKENDSVDIILVTSNGDMLIEMPVRKPGTQTHANGHDNMKKDDRLEFKSDEHADMDKKEHADMNKDEYSDMNKDDAAQTEAEKNEYSDMKKDGAAHTETTKVVR